MFHKYSYRTEDSHIARAWETDICSPYRGYVLEIEGGGTQDAEPNIDLGHPPYSSKLPCRSRKSNLSVPCVVSLDSLSSANDWKPLPGSPSSAPSKRTLIVGVLARMTVRHWAISAACRVSDKSKCGCSSVITTMYMLLASKARWCIVC